MFWARCRGGPIPGVMEILTYIAQGSQMVSNLWAVSDSMLASFSWAITHETFCLTAFIETDGCLQALAKVSLVPKTMKCINLWLYLEIFGMCEFSRATSGVLGTLHPVTTLMSLKIFFQKDLILGHSHQMCANMPFIWHP